MSSDISHIEHDRFDSQIERYNEITEMRLSALEGRLAITERQLRELRHAVPRPSARHQHVDGEASESAVNCEAQVLKHSEAMKIFVEKFELWEEQGVEHMRIIGEQGKQHALGLQNISEHVEDNCSSVAAECRVFCQDALGHLRQELTAHIDEVSDVLETAVQMLVRFLPAASAVGTACLVRWNLLNYISSHQPGSGEDSIGDGTGRLLAMRASIWSCCERLDAAATIARIGAEPSAVHKTLRSATPVLRSMSPMPRCTSLSAHRPSSPCDELSRLQQADSCLRGAGSFRAELGNCLSGIALPTLQSPNSSPQICHRQVAMHTTSVVAPAPGPPPPAGVVRNIVCAWPRSMVPPVSPR